MVPKYNPIPMVEITLNNITNTPMPNILGICPKPKTTDETIIAI